MKKILFILILLFATSSFSDDLGLFSSATIQNEEITLTFREQGLRYKIIVNGENLGISQYGQVLIILTTDTLKLTEKHYSYMISYLHKEGKDYLNIDVTGQDPVKGSEINQKHVIELPKRVSQRGQVLN